VLQLKKLNNKEYIRHLSPDLEELFRSCLELEKMYEKFRFLEAHDLMPTIDMIWETITISDRIMGLVKAIILTERSSKDSLITDEMYNVWKKSWNKYESELRKLKDKITAVGMGTEEAVKLKVSSFLADYVSFIRANIYPVFINYSRIITTNPEIIYRTIEKRFAVMFVRRFIKGEEVEEEEEGE